MRRKFNFLSLNFNIEMWVLKNSDIVIESLLSTLKLGENKNGHWTDMVILPDSGGWLMGHGGLDNIIHDISKRVTHPKEVTKIRHNRYYERKGRMCCRFGKENPDQILCKLS